MNRSPATDGAILFTAFEPSGDALAAAVISQLKQHQPDRPIYAFGGPQMAKAGAELLETTTEHAVMLGGAIAQAMEHRRRLKRLRQWLAEHPPLAALVPTDSPAANWSICQAVRDTQPKAKIVHLVAPQLWAWAPWRVRKLRRLTDGVLCLLPFEPTWLGERGVPATLVGHPLFSAQAQQPVTDPALPEKGKINIALLPGSRSSEIKANWPTMLEVYRKLAAEHPGMVACIAASDESRAQLITSMLPSQTMPPNMHMVTANASAVLDWADVALVVSGTATLHTASRKTPMVVLYNVKRLAWHMLGRWLIQTRTFALPNVITDWLGKRRAVPEFVPHHGQVEPIANAMRQLMNQPAQRQQQLEAFADISNCFTNQSYATLAADAIHQVVDAGQLMAIVKQSPSP